MLAGEGPAFCVGAELNLFRTAAESGRIDEMLTPLLVGMHTITRNLRALPFPTVAAGGGRRRRGRGRAGLRL